MHGYRATDIAWEVPVKSSSERLIVLALAKFSDENCESFPSFEAIAKFTKLNRKTVISGLKSLAESGVISVQKSGHTANLYRLIGSPKNGGTEIGSPKLGSPNIGSPKNGTGGVPKTVPGESQNWDGGSTEIGTRTYQLTNQLTDQRTDKGNKYHHIVDGVAPVQICTSAQNCTHPKKEKTKTQAFKPPELGVELTETAFKDWMTVRKAKHSPLTETAWKHFKAQVVKSGLSVQQAVELCATRGWISINADWQAVKDYEKETDSRSSMDRTVANVIKALGITDDTKEEGKDTVDDWI